MKKRLSIFLGVLFFLTGLCTHAGAQVKAQHFGIPDEVYYLMPSFGEGTAYLRGQAPATGKMNICAVDNTLRYLNKSGEEMSSGNTDNIVKVRIDSVLFLRYDKVFYRLYPHTNEVGIACRRIVNVIKDAKDGSYGTATRGGTSSVGGAAYSDGNAYRLDHETIYPYDVTERLYIFVRDAVLPFNKKNLAKAFPRKQEEIKAWFKSHHSTPDKVDDALALIALFAD